MDVFEAEGAAANFAMEVHVFVAVLVVMMPMGMAYLVAYAFGTAFERVQEVFFAHRGEASEDARFVQRRYLCLKFFQGHGSSAGGEGLEHKYPVGCWFHSSFFQEMGAFFRGHVHFESFSAAIYEISFYICTDADIRIGLKTNTILMKKYIAEFIGTAVLTLMGCGTAVFLGCGDTAGVLGTAIAFGLSVVAMAYCIGGISGCHINPAITLGVALSGRMGWKDACGYWVGQFLGGIAGAAILFAIVAATGAPGAMGNPEGLGTNGVANAGGNLGACLVEVVGTFVFVLMVLGATDEKKGAGNLAGLAIGLTLVLVHLVCINLTGTSVNPARSLGPALFVGGEALKCVWVFIVAPLVGGALAACTWKAIAK